MYASPYFGARCAGYLELLWRTDGVRRSITTSKLFNLQEKSVPHTRNEFKCFTGTAGDARLCPGNSLLVKFSVVKFFFYSAQSKLYFKIRNFHFLFVRKTKCSSC